jgi:hypothetical protein
MTTIVTMSMELPPFMEARESAPARAGAARRLVWPLGRNYGARFTPRRHDGRSSVDRLAEAQVLLPGFGPAAGDSTRAPGPRHRASRDDLALG